MCFKKIKNYFSGLNQGNGLCGFRKCVLCSAALIIRIAGIVFLFKALWYPVKGAASVISWNNESLEMLRLFLTGVFLLIIAAAVSEN